MKLDIVNNETWHLLNQKITSSINLPSSKQLRFYPTVGIALFEIATGLSHFFSHKKSIGYIKGQSSHFHVFLPYFYKEMFQFSNIGPSIFESPEEWVNSLANDTLFVLFSEDHGLTGQTYNWQYLDKLLNDRKIYSIRISHNSHYFDKEPPLPFSIRILSLNDESGSISILGERVKSPPIFSHAFSFSKIDPEVIIKQIICTNKADPQKILQFEKKLTDISTPFFSNKVHQRLFDRAALKFPNINGEALASIIKSKLTVVDQRSVSSGNLCSFSSHNPHFFSQWWDHDEDRLQLNNVVFISSELIDIAESELEKIIRDAYFEISKFQTWS